MLYLTLLYYDTLNLKTPQKGAFLSCVRRAPNACEMGCIVERLNERVVASAEEPTGAHERA